MRRATPIARAIAAAALAACGARTGPEEPELVPGRSFGGTPVDISVSAASGCAAMADGAVWCWGDWLQGERDERAVSGRGGGPRRRASFSRITRLGVGFGDVCGLRRDGVVLCEGDDETVSGQPVPAARALPGLTNVVALAVSDGAPKTVLRGDGTVCRIDAFSAASFPCEPPSMPPVVQVVGRENIGRTVDGTLRDVLRAAGTAPTWLPRERVTELFDGDVLCGRFTTGRIGCWGGGAGVLGGVWRGPEFVYWLSGADDVRSIAVGERFYCVVRGDATVWCAGANDVGQLGDGTTMRRTTLAPVPGLDDVVQLVTGGITMCVRRADGTVWCWGRSMDGAFERWTTPHQIALPR